VLIITLLNTVVLSAPVLPFVDVRIVLTKHVLIPFTYLVSCL